MVAVNGAQQIQTAYVLLRNQYMVEFSTYMDIGQAMYGASRKAIVCVALMKIVIEKFLVEDAQLRIKIHIIK